MSDDVHSCREVIEEFDEPHLFCIRCGTVWCFECLHLVDCDDDDGEVDWADCPVCTGDAVDADRLLAYAADRYKFNRYQLWREYRRHELAIPILIEAMSDGKTSLLPRLAELAGSCAAGCVPDLIKYLRRCSKPQDVQDVATALGFVGTAAKPALPMLKQMMDDSNPVTRAISASAVYRIESGHYEAIKVMRELTSWIEGELHSLSPRHAVDTLRSIASALGTGHPPSSDVLQILADISTLDMWERQGFDDTALCVLGDFGCVAGPVLPQMISSVRRFNVHDPLKALRAIANVSPRAVIDDLRSLLIEAVRVADDDNEQLLRILQSIESGVNDGRDLVAALFEEALDGVNETVAIEVLWNLVTYAECGDITERTLISLLECGDQDVCEEALYAATKLTKGSDEVIAAVIKLLNSDVGTLREEAARTLGRLGAVAADTLDNLRRIAATDKDNAVRRAATVAVGRIWYSMAGSSK